MRILGFVIGVALVGLAGVWYMVMKQSVYWHEHNQAFEELSVQAPQQLKNSQLSPSAPEQQTRALCAEVAPLDQVEQSSADRARLNHGAESQAMVCEASGESLPLPRPKQPEGDITDTEKDSLASDVQIKVSTPEFINPSNDAHTPKTKATMGIEEKISSFDNDEELPLPSMETRTLGLSSTEQERATKVDQSGIGVQAVTPNLSWQVFWKPFHRRLSAGGFAQRLSEVTGLPIEVKEQTRGEYVIAFPYADESERQHNIELIERLTGFNLVIGDPE